MHFLLKFVRAYGFLAAQFSAQFSGLNGYRPFQTSQTARQASYSLELFSFAPARRGLNTARTRLASDASVAGGEGSGFGLADLGGPYEPTPASVAMTATATASRTMVAMKPDSKFGDAISALTMYRRVLNLRKLYFGLKLRLPKREAPNPRRWTVEHFLKLSTRRYVRKSNLAALQMVRAPFRGCRFEPRMQRQNRALRDQKPRTRKPPWRARRSTMGRRVRRRDAPVPLDTRRRHGAAARRRRGADAL
jgi:hypothetical protein